MMAYDVDEDPTASDAFCEAAEPFIEETALRECREGSGEGLPHFLDVFSDRSFAVAYRLCLSVTLSAGGHSSPVGVLQCLLDDIAASATQHIAALARIHGGLLLEELALWFFDRVLPHVEAALILDARSRNWVRLDSWHSIALLAAAACVHVAEKWEVVMVRHTSSCVPQNWGCVVSNGSFVRMELAVLGIVDWKMPRAAPIDALAKAMLVATKAIRPSRARVGGKSSAADSLLNCVLDCGHTLMRLRTARRMRPSLRVAGAVVAAIALYGGRSSELARGGALAASKGTEAAAKARVLLRRLVRAEEWEMDAAEVQASAVISVRASAAGARTATVRCALEEASHFAFCNDQCNDTGGSVSKSRVMTDTAPEAADVADASAPQAEASLKTSPAEELAAITNEARERLATLGLGMNTSDKPGLSVPPADAGAAREGARQGGHASEPGIGVTGSAASGGVLTKTAGSVEAAGKGGGAHNIVSHSDLQARPPAAKLAVQWLARRLARACCCGDSPGTASDDEDELATKKAKGAY